MPTMYITEFAQEGVDAQGRITPIAKVPAVAQQAVVFTGTSAQSAVLSDATTIVRLQADANCSVSIGTNPTATAAQMRMVAGQTEYFSVQPGGALKIAAITNV